MSLEFDIACLRCPTDPSDTIGVAQLISRAKMAAEQIERLMADKKKLYGWIDDANFKKNEYLARAEKAEQEREMLLAKLTHAATDFIDQNGCKPLWWTEDIVKMVKQK